MRNNLFLSASVSALLLGATSPAMAADALAPATDSYISIFGGYNWAREQMGYAVAEYDIKLKNGFTVGAAYGRHIGNGFRWESELAFVANDHSSYRTDNGTFDPDISDGVSSLFILGNIWKDFRLTDSIQPYVGVGLGTAISSSVENDDNTWDGSSVGLAGQMGAGVRIAMTDKIAMDASYRVRASIDPTIESVGGNENGVFSHYSHTAQLGVVYAIGDSQVMPQHSGDPAVWYVSLFGGAVATATNFNYDDSTQYLIDHKTGFTVGGAIGTHMAPGLRAELELSYVRSALDSYTTTTSVAAGPASGDLNQLYILGNIWRDIDLGGSITPYIGGGVGFGFIGFDNAAIDGNITSDDKGLGLAGQFGFGARMAVSDNMSVDVGYRFKSIVDSLIIGGNDFTNNGELAATNHVLQFGVNYGLGAATGEASGIPDSRYVSLFGGGVLPLETHGNVDGHDYLVKFNTGFTVGAAVGSNITENLRGEVEASVHSYDVNEVYQQGFVNGAASGNITGYFLMANLWRDMDLGVFKPYAGGGVGIGLMDTDIDFAGNNHIVGGKSAALALQVGSGVRFDLTDNVILDLGYRFKAVNSVLSKDVNTTFNTNYNSSSFYTQSVQAGVTWKF